MKTIIEMFRIVFEVFHPFMIIGVLALFFCFTHYGLILIVLVCYLIWAVIKIDPFPESKNTNKGSVQ